MSIYGSNYCFFFFKQKTAYEVRISDGRSCVCSSDRLERQFLPGMSWDNRGEWHIDHIRPLCAFEFTSPDDPQFREAWALTNLRPLWARDNLRKGGRLDLLL